jgi:hypothetical protein
MSSTRRSNAIISISMNGMLVKGVQGVSNVVFDHFNNHLKKVDKYRPGLGELMFKFVDDVEGSDLIKPFLMEEIKEAKWECDSFKSPWLDGIKHGFYFKIFGIC